MCHKILFFSFCLVALVSPFSAAGPYADAAPFRGTTLAGEAFSFEPDRLQKPALAVFWASWCVECRYEFHELKKLHEETRGRLEIVGVTVDKDIDKAKDISRRAGLPYISVFDPNAAIAALYQVQATPTIVLVDRTGKIRHVGHRVNQAFRAVLHEVLGSL
jgi:cytochrome c biogenesis protein CcmG/thiol:disulfide interchange protein DsbE